MYARQPRHKRCILLPLAAILAVFNMGFGRVTAQAITQIIDSAGIGVGNGLDFPLGIAMDSAGNTYVVGGNSNNAFKITPAGVPVDGEGRPRGDMDGDCDLDLADHRLFALFFTGP